jgi:hypothetical protein
MMVEFMFSVFVLAECVARPLQLVVACYLSLKLLVCVTMLT